MFIQVIQGKVADAAGLHAAMDRWVQKLQPGATGFLGCTAGITDDGTFIAAVRFESAEAARRNSDRPEQGAWWAETAICFDGVSRPCRTVFAQLRLARPRILRRPRLPR
jgi:hypothetical protein